MEYVPYDELDGRPSIVVDGTPAPGTVLTLSHWRGAGTPEELADDLSTQIAFRYLDRPDLRADADAVSNNHFDEDGLCGIFAALEPVAAQQRRKALIQVASAGDFKVCDDPGARHAAFVLRTYMDAARSPLPNDAFDAPYPQQSATLYRELLARLEQIVDEPDKRLWEEEEAAFQRDDARVRSGAITIEERPDVDLAIVTVPDDGPEAVTDDEEGWTGGLHPMAVYGATGMYRVLFERGRRAELRYRYETWVRYVSRPTLPRVDLAPLAARLTDGDDGEWTFDGVRDLTPALRRKDGGPTTIARARLVDAVVEHLVRA
jgi:hypothetical protein